ncbi:MAG: glycosyltransferase, partial [Polyangiales bacterium]
VAHWLVPAGLVVAETLPRDARVDVELVAHGADVRFLSALPRSLSRRLLERITLRVSRVRAVSDSLAARLVALAPSVAAKLVVAPMPLATDDDEVCRRARAAATQLAGGARPLHVVASRLTVDKRVERAIDHVAARGGRLVVVGDGPRHAALIERARRRGIEARFVGARPHEETLAWIAAADVVLAPLARDEGAPTVAREAEALGRPVVCFA